MVSRKCFLDQPTVLDILIFHFLFWTVSTNVHNSDHEALHDHYWLVKCNSVY